MLKQKLRLRAINIKQAICLDCLSEKLFYISNFSALPQHQPNYCFFLLSLLNLFRLSLVHTRQVPTWNELLNHLKTAWSRMFTLSRFCTCDIPGVASRGPVVAMFTLKKLFTGTWTIIQSDCL